MRPIRTFVCHGATTLEMVDGQTLVAGRGASCDITLDDDLASREHLELTLTAGRLVVIDLESRNGVLVNGLPVKGQLELHHGDHVTAGRTPITVVRQVHEPRRRPESQPQRFRVTADVDSKTETGSLYELLEGSTRMALEAGDLTSAEGSGRSLLVAIRSYIARGLPMNEDWILGAVGLALELGMASNEPVWLDRSLDLHTTARVSMDASTAERLAALAVRIPPSKGSLDGYLAMARELGDDDSLSILEPVVAQLGE